MVVRVRGAPLYHSRLNKLTVLSSRMLARVRWMRWMCMLYQVLAAAFRFIGGSQVWANGIGGQTRQHWWCNYETQNFFTKNRFYFVAGHWRSFARGEMDGWLNDKGSFERNPFAAHSTSTTKQNLEIIELMLGIWRKLKCFEEMYFLQNIFQMP